MRLVHVSLASHDFQVLTPKPCQLKMYRVIITTMPLSSTSNKKLSTSACIKLSLIDSDDDFGEEISIDDKYDKYMVLSHCAYAKISVLTFWQICPEIYLQLVFKPLAWILGA
jgi:hypothetical protein